MKIDDGRSDDFVMLLQNELIFRDENFQAFILILCTHVETGHNRP